MPNQRADTSHVNPTNEGVTMEVKIGVQHAPRELVVETELSPEEFEAQLTEAVDGGSILAFTDARGRRIAVPGSKIAYVEIGTGAHGTVGFR